MMNFFSSSITRLRLLPLNKFFNSVHESVGFFFNKCFFHAKAWLECLFISNLSNKHCFVSFKILMNNSYNVDGVMGQRVNPSISLPVSRLGILDPTR